MTCKWGLNIALVMIFTEIVGDSGSAVHYPKLCHVCGKSSTKLDGIQTWSISTLLGAVQTFLSRYVLTLETDVHMTWIFFPPKNAMIRLILLTCFWKHMEKIWSNIRSWSPPLHCINMGFGGLQSTRSFPQIRRGALSWETPMHIRQFIMNSISEDPNFRYHEAP